MHARRPAPLALLLMAVFAEPRCGRTAHARPTSTDGASVRTPGAKRAPPTGHDATRFTGDLHAIKKRGELRVLAHRTEVGLLARRSMPSLHDIEDAEAFAETLGCRPDSSWWTGSMSSSPRWSPGGATSRSRRRSTMRSGGPKGELRPRGARRRRGRRAKSGDASSPHPAQRAGRPPRGGRGRLTVRGHPHRPEKKSRPQPRDRPRSGNPRPRGPRRTRGDGETGASSRLSTAICSPRSRPTSMASSDSSRSRRRPRSAGRYASATSNYEPLSTASCSSAR